MVAITLVRHTIKLTLKSINFDLNLFPIILSFLKILAYLLNFLSILVEECFSVYKNFVDLVIHLAYFCNVFIVVVLDYIHNGLLLFV